MPFHVDFNNFNPGGYQSGNAGGFTPPPRKARKPRKAIGSAAVRTLINLLVTAVFGLLYYYAELPALNFQAEEFYVFIFLLCAVYCVSAALTSGFQAQGARGYFQFARKQCAVPFFVVAALLAVIAVGAVSSWIVLRAGAYSKLLTVETGDFTSEVEEISYDQIPMLDDDSAARLGNRKLGELSDMVSQFEVMDTYTQINYQGRPVRVTSLRYGDIIKWLTNRKAGLPAYLIIDMVTQNVEVVRLEEGMKYTTAEHFSRNLYRYLRFRYPTYMFEEPVFEIDEEGTPWWVCPRIVKTGRPLRRHGHPGAVLVNAVTGESQYYEQVPDLGGPGLLRRPHHAAVRLLRPVPPAFSTPSSARRT
jgi:hypothetical protein